jgi:DNA-binding CsgD family transcriptional regulator
VSIAVARAAGVTVREARIVNLASHGLTTAEIAWELDLAPGTVFAGLNSLFAGLGVPNRAALVAWGFRVGLLTPHQLSEDLAAGPVRRDLARLLPLIAEGLTDESIGRRIGCTAFAVGARVRGLRGFLGARNREHTVRPAVEAGFLRVSADGSRLVLADHVSGGMS